MKLARVLLLAAGSTLAVAGCAKATDLSAKQQETTGYARSYDEKLYEMFQRANDYLARLKQLDTVPGSQDAHNALSRMNSVYKGMKQLADTVPTQVDAAVKAGKPDALRNLAMGLGVNPAPPGTQLAPATDMHVELQRVMDSLHARLADGYLEANAHLDAVEAWLLRVENVHGTADDDPPQAVPHPAPPPPKDGDKDGDSDGKGDKDEPPPAGAGSGSATPPPAGAGSGSAAPQPAKGSGAR